MFINTPDSEVATTGSSPVLVYEAALVNLNTSTDQVLLTNNQDTGGKSFYPTAVWAGKASTSLTTASWSIGTNSTAFNDWVANATHTGLTAATVAAPLTLVATGITVLPPGGTLKLKNNTLQGAAATCSIFIAGYFA